MTTSCDITYYYHYYYYYLFYHHIDKIDVGHHYHNCSKTKHKTKTWTDGQDEAKQDETQGSHVYNPNCGAKQRLTLTTLATDAGFTSDTNSFRRRQEDARKGPLNPRSMNDQWRASGLNPEHVFCRKVQVLLRHIAWKARRMRTKKREKEEEDDDDDESEGLELVGSHLHYTFNSHADSMTFELSTRDGWMDGWMKELMAQSHEERTAIIQVNYIIIIIIIIEILI